MAEHMVRRQLPRFAVVGGIGFIVDATVLTILVNGMGMGPISARGFSFSVAVTATWWLNRRWAFKDSQRVRRGPEYARYLAAQVVGAGINLAIYLAVTYLYPALGLVPVIPLAIGSGVAMVFNFIAARYWVFPAVQR